MPDWLTTLITAIISAASGAGGVVAYLKMRQDARITLATHQDDYTLKLRDALDKDEAEFRKTVYDAFRAEVARNRELDERLTVTQKELTVVGLERDELRRKLDRTQVELDRAKADLNEAHKKIRHLEDEIAALQAQQPKET